MVELQRFENKHPDLLRDDLPDFYRLRKITEDRIADFDFETKFSGVGIMNVRQVDHGTFHNGYLP
jgi:hypothetical protein